MSNTNNQTARKATMEEVREYVERNIYANRETYIIKSDLPEEEIVLFRDELSSNGLRFVKPETLAAAIRDVLKSMNKRYFATLDRSTYLPEEMRFFIESGLGKPAGYALVDEKPYWHKDSIENRGAAIVFELI